MTFVWIVVGIVVLAVIGAIAYYGVPEGWEDENGFHYGRKK
jgi:hypothetical protein